MNQYFAILICLSLYSNAVIIVLVMVRFLLGFQSISLLILSSTPILRLIWFSQLIFKLSSQLIIIFTLRLFSTLRLSSQPVWSSPPISTPQLTLFSTLTLSFILTLTLSFILTLTLSSPLPPTYKLSSPPQ